MVALPYFLKQQAMKKYNLIWIDGAITCETDIDAINPAYIQNGNIVAIIDADNKTYLSLDTEERTWLPLPEPVQIFAHAES